MARWGVETLILGALAGQLAWTGGCRDGGPSEQGHPGGQSVGPAAPRPSPVPETDVPPPAAPGQPPSITTLAPGSVCIRDGWCFYHPLPHGLDYKTAWASSAHDAWFGLLELPALVHADAQRWSLVELPDEVSAVSLVGGSGPGQVWFVGMVLVPPYGEVLYRRAGDRWELTHSLELAYDFWVGGDGHVWVPDAHYTAGAGRFDTDVLAFDPATSAWTVHAFPETLISSVWASAPDDVWAGGGLAPGDSTLPPQPVVYHFDGSAWQKVPAPDSVGSVTKIRGAVRGEPWLTAGPVQGLGATLWRWDGSAWQTEIPPRDDVSVINDLDVVGAHEAWVSVSDYSQRTGRSSMLHLTGSPAPSSIPVPVPATCVHCAPDGDCFFAGAGGELWFGSSGSASPQRLTVGAHQSTEALWGTGTDSTWAVGNGDDGAGQLLHVTLAGATQVKIPLDAGEPRAVWAADDSNIWIVGASGVVRYDAATGVFEQAAGAAATATDLVAIWGSGRDDVWMGGGSTVLHWNGAGFELPSYGGFIVHDVGGGGVNDVWIVGQGMAHFDGRVWTAQDPPPASSDGYRATVGWAVWANGASEVYLGTNDSLGGAVWWLDGASWTRLDFARHGGVERLFGAGPRDLWSSGYFLDRHFTAGQRDAGALDQFDEVRYWGESASHMWAASNGSVLRRVR